MHEAQAILLRLLRFAPGPAWHRNPAPRRTYPRRPVLMPSSRPEICPGYAQSEFSEGSLPAKRQLVEKVAIDPADLKTDQFKSERLGKRIRFALAPITFCIGVVATLAWLSYADAARRTIANSFPRLACSAPQSPPA